MFPGQQRASRGQIHMAQETNFYVRVETYVTSGLSKTDQVYKLIRICLETNKTVSLFLGILIVQFSSTITECQGRILDLQSTQVHTCSMVSALCVGNSSESLIL